MKILKSILLYQVLNAQDEPTTTTVTSTVATTSFATTTTTTTITTSIVGKNQAKKQLEFPIEVHAR